MKIAIFDSGMGGITVLKEALELLPAEDYIYYADTLHVPYGEKLKQDVKRFILTAAEIIAAMNIKAFVIACNTATSIAVNDLRVKYSFPVIGMEPAVKPAVCHNKSSGKRVLVFATPLTLQEAKFHELVSRVDHDHIVDFLPMPELVNYAESLEFRDEVIVPYLCRKLAEYNLEQYGTVVLGCTHFPLFMPSFRRFFPPDIEIIDGAHGTAMHLKTILEEQKLTGTGSGKIEFYSSGNSAADKAKFQQLLDRACQAHSSGCAKRSGQ